MLAHALACRGHEQQEDKDQRSRIRMSHWIRGTRCAPISLKLIAILASIPVVTSLPSFLKDPRPRLGASGQLIAEPEAADETLGDIRGRKRHRQAASMGSPSTSRAIHLASMHFNITDSLRCAHCVYDSGPTSMLMLGLHQVGTSFAVTLGDKLLNTSHAPEMRQHVFFSSGGDAPSFEGTVLVDAASGAPLQASIMHSDGAVTSAALGATCIRTKVYVVAGDGSADNEPLYAIEQGTTSGDDGTIKSYVQLTEHSGEKLDFHPSLFKVHASQYTDGTRYMEFHFNPKLCGVNATKYISAHLNVSSDDPQVAAGVAFLYNGSNPFFSGASVNVTATRDMCSSGQEFHRATISAKLESFSELVTAPSALTFEQARMKIHALSAGTQKSVSALISTVARLVPSQEVRSHMNPKCPRSV